jgi:MFS family permease
MQSAGVVVRRVARPVIDAKSLRRSGEVALLVALYSPADASTPTPSPPETLAVLSLSLLIIGLDNTVLNVALPTLQTHFSASGSTLQWIVDSYLLAFAGVLLTMGTLGDRFGRKRALQSGLVLFGVASVLAAFARNADQLIVLRAAMGIGGAMIMPATLSVITDIFPREERGKAIGICDPAPSTCPAPACRSPR